MFVDNKVSEKYLDVVNDRVSELALGVAGPSQTARQVVAIVDAAATTNNVDQAVSLARDIIDAQKSLSKNPEIVNHDSLIATFTQIAHPDRDNLITKLVAAFRSLKDTLRRTT